MPSGLKSAAPYKVRTDPQTRLTFAQACKHEKTVEHVFQHGTRATIKQMKQARRAPKAACQEVDRGMATLQALPVARHCIRLSGPCGREAAGQLRDRLKTLEGADTGGTLVSSWTPEEHRGAVLTPVAHVAIPLVVEGLRKMLGTVPLKGAHYRQYAGDRRGGACRH